MTERSHGHHRHRDAARRMEEEAAIAEGVRARVEETWRTEEEKEGITRSPEERAELARWRLKGLGAGFTIAVLGIIGALKRDDAGLKKYQRTMAPEEETAKRKKAEESGGEFAFDEATGNLTSGPAKEDWEHVKREPLVTYSHCGREVIGARESAARAHLEASEDSRRAIGRCISISPSELAAFRTNEAQAGAKKRNTALWGLWETGAAAKATRGLHEVGRAYDMGQDWWLEWPFMKAHGFQCGPDNGIASHWDLWHCQKTRRPEPSETTKEKIWKKRCREKPGLCPPDWKTHRWQGTIQEVVDFWGSQKSAAQEHERKKMSREKRRRRN